MVDVCRDFLPFEISTTNFTLAGIGVHLCVDGRG